MASLDVTALYRSVIDEVVTKSRAEFVQEGVDEAVLDEMRLLWEEKLQQSGALAPEAARPFANNSNTVTRTPTLNALNPSFVPGFYTNQGQRPSQLGRPALHMPSPPHRPVTSQQVSGISPGLQHRPQGLSHNSVQSSLQSSAVPPRPHQAVVLQQGLPTIRFQAQLQGASELRVQPESWGAYHTFPTPNTSQQYAISQQQQNSASPANRAVSQGIADTGAASLKRKAEDDHTSGRAMQPGFHPKYTGIPQQDGPSDNGSDLPEGAEESPGENEEEAVDNLSDVDSSEHEEDEDIPNHCISQFTKVSRTKNRWKCQLNAGVLHLRGRDYLFNSASGEFQF